VESVFWNPANLGFSKGSEKSLMLFSLGINAYNNSFNLKQYNQYNGKFLTSEDKQTILADGEAFASVNIGFSYGRSVWKKDKKEILCGINARYMHGLAYQKIKEARGEIFALETGVNGDGDFAVQSAEGGKGCGLDFGLALEYNDNWTFGLSFINLINQIKWGEKTEKRGYQVQIDSLLAENFDLDSLVIEDSYTEEIDPFTTQIPTLMHVGVAYQGKRLLWAFDVKHGFKEGMGISRKLRASLGAEYELLGWLDVRGGISIGGNEGVTVANGVGFKLGTYHLDLGIAMQKGLWPTRSKGINLAISNGFYF